MAHVGMSRAGAVEIIDNHTVIAMSYRDAKKLLKELDRIIKWLDHKEAKKK